MKTRVHIYTAFLVVLALASSICGYAKWFHGKSKKSSKQDTMATVLVAPGLSGCNVDIDGVKAGETSNEGSLSIKNVKPGDHYVHVECPHQRARSSFISPQAGQTIKVQGLSVATDSPDSENSPLNPLVSEMQLRHLVTQAVQLRASGQVNEAVELLRKAIRLDPANGDLHRELGMTFLMFHEWEQARVEMLEAVYREPDSVDAHSGLAFALEKIGDLDGALKQYEICRHMDPHDTSYRDHYIEVLGKVYANKNHKKH